MATARAFISHAAPDSKIAARLADDLRALGVDTWLDSTHMGPGDFVSRLNQALQRDVLILVLSPSAIASPWVQKEMNAAIARSNQGLMLPPVVIMVQSCSPAEIPPLWTVYHRYDAVQNYGAALTKVFLEIAPNKGATSEPPLTKGTKTDNKTDQPTASLIALRNVSHPWMMRNLLIVHGLGLVGLIPPSLFTLTNLGNASLGCTALFSCLTTSPIYTFTNILAGIAWSIGGLVLLFTLFGSFILIAQMRRWPWFAGIIVPGLFFIYPILGLWAFILVGPKTRHPDK